MNESIIFILTTVDSLIFDGYQFLWVQANHEIKCSKNNKFSIGFYADFRKTTK